jgi:alkanesulfonate monooxygenase SsuD/methylene tetrahydromethanopterin reductase-like flavin-dependent oxidoreductase (luciferase family)
MRFSVFMISMGTGRSSDRQVYDDALADARLADRLGFEAFWFAEHHFNGDFCMSPSPNLLVASAARETERIKLGVAVNVLPMHHPVRLAEEGAMLDQLTNGRFMWGIGRGIVGREFLPFGVDSTTARARFNEIHDTVINGWASGRIECHGRFHDFQGVDLYPNVLQRPHPPVWVAAQSPESVAWCASRDYIAMQVGEPIEQTRRHAERYRRAAADAGIAIREGGIVPLRYCFVAESDEIAREKCAPYLRDFWHHFTRIAAPGGVIPDRSGYEYWYEEGDLSRYATDDYDLLNHQGIIICGSPRTVIEHLRRQAELVGTDRFLLDFWRGSLKREDRIRSLELFGKEVIPALRGAPVTAAA